jgi:hypothetical protein
MRRDECHAGMHLAGTYLETAAATSVEELLFSKPNRAVDETALPPSARSSVLIVLPAALPSPTYCASGYDVAPAVSGLRHLMSPTPLCETGAKTPPKSHPVREASGSNSQLFQSQLDDPARCLRQDGAFLKTSQKEPSSVKPKLSCGRGESGEHV